MNYKKTLIRGFVAGLIASTILLSNQLIAVKKDNNTLLNELNAQTTKILELEANIEKIKAQNEALTKENKSLRKEVEKWIKLDDVLITAYCPCEECSGKWGRQTKTGATAVQGETIAVDPSVIPLGATVQIEGDDNTYIAQDIGGKVDGKHVDVFFNDHLVDYKKYKTIRYKVEA